MSDTLLSCFSFRPNWGEGVQERLSFFTTLLRADEGAEQRQAVRQTPRRSLEASFLLHGPERAFFDIFMHRLSAQEITVPLYWDVVRLPVQTVAGVTNRLNFDTTHTEFAVGKAIIIQGATALDFEVIDVAAVDAGGIDLSTATGRSWPAGSRVMPLRRALIDDLGELEHESADVANVVTRLTVKDANTWTPAVDGSPVYLGLPILESEPNWVGGLSSELQHDVVDYDAQVGLVYRTDPVGRANVGQEHRYFLQGRSGLASARDLLYRHQGRRGEFWLPTFKRDLELVGSHLAAESQIEIENIGLAYAGGPGSGREHIIIWTFDGQRIARQITDATLTGNTETLDLDAPLGLDLSPGLVRKISFMDTARFDQDDFEFTHYTDSTGLTELTTTFRSFPNIRTAPTPLSVPIPVAAESAEPCGIVEPWACATVAPVFEGWYYKVSLVMPGNVSGIGGGSLSMWLNSLLGTQQYSSFYYTDGNGEFNPARLSETHQFQRAADSSFVNLYVHTDRGDIREIEIQMQQLGGGSTSEPPFVNYLTFQQWDQEAQGPLPTRQSVWITPGQNSDEGNGITLFPRAGNFPDNHFFGVT